MAILILAAVVAEVITALELLKLQVAEEEVTAAVVVVDSLKVTLGSMVAEEELEDLRVETQIMVEMVSRE